MSEVSELVLGGSLSEWVCEFWVRKCDCNWMSG